MAVSGGIMMILEFDNPGPRVLRVSDEPMRKALIQMGR
jgi:hypothetical protein